MSDLVRGDADALDRAQSEAGRLRLVGAHPFSGAREGAAAVEPGVVQRGAARRIGAQMRKPMLDARPLGHPDEQAMGPLGQ